MEGYKVCKSQLDEILTPAECTILKYYLNLASSFILSKSILPGAQSYPQSLTVTSQRNLLYLIAISERKELSIRANSPASNPGKKPSSRVVGIQYTEQKKDAPESKNKNIL
ncbi:hypothetical protein AtEden1_Chr3g0186061 [Arabidopsis thaliana]